MNAIFIDPGALRHELSLQRLEDAPGIDASQWVECGRLFAQIEPVDALSQFGAARWLESATHRVTMRYRPDLASGMRLVKEARIFTVLTATDPDETRRYLICRTREEKS